MRRKVIASTNRLTTREKLKCQLFDMLIDQGVEIDGMSIEDILVSMQGLYPDASVLDLEELLDDGHSMQEALNILEQYVLAVYKKYGE